MSIFDKIASKGFVGFERGGTTYVIDEANNKAVGIHLPEGQDEDALIDAAISTLPDSPALDVALWRDKGDFVLIPPKSA